MKIIHQNGYTKEELALYRITVYKNLVDSAQALVYAMRKFRKEPRKPENRVSNHYISVLITINICIVKIFNIITNLLLFYKYFRFLLKKFWIIMLNPTRLFS